jgi:hypothetical protein
MMASERGVAAAVLAAACALAGPALAEPTAADKDTARGRMAEGRADREKGDLAGALKAFAAADAIMHVPTTGLELARAQAAVGQLIEARETAARVTRTAERPNEPAPFRAARQAATSFDGELEPRIPSLTIVVRDGAGHARPQVKLDGVVVPPEQLGQPRKVNPGHHTVESFAGGDAAGAKAAGDVQSVDLAEGESKRVALGAPAPESPAVPEPSAAEPAPEAEAPPPSGSPLSPALMYGGFGLAGAGVLLGSITGFVSLSQATSIKSSGQCLGNSCTSQEHGAIESANTMATISTISFAAAGVGALAGVVGLLLRGPGDHPSPSPAEAPASATSRVEPWLGLGAAGVRGSF